MRIIPLWLLAHAYLLYRVMRFKGNNLLFIKSSEGQIPVLALFSPKIVAGVQNMKINLSIVFSRTDFKICVLFDLFHQLHDCDNIMLINKYLAIEHCSMPQ